MLQVNFKMMLVLCVAAAAILLFFYWARRSTTAPTANREVAMSISGRAYILEVAETAESRARGLSGRSKMGEDRGMLFIFDRAGVYPFWMKDTLIPLDIIWLKDGEIKDIVTLEAPTSTLFTPIHMPLVLADAALELNAGEANKLGLEVGDRLELPRRIIDK
ncbi:MAG: DUF192 domain-containing protein [Patescibacteria group bacterium]|nr:DUF192 domain-containing protein [Patescibacteria group bacterium]